MTLARWALTAAALFAGTRTWADSLTLTPSKDNTLFEDVSVPSSDGAGAYIFAGKTCCLTEETLLRRAVLAFDLSAIPPGSIVTSASLTLNLDKESRFGEVPFAMSLHRLSASFGEGASHAPGEEGQGTPAMPGDATWTYRFYPDTFWSTVGGDFVVAPSATIMVGGVLGLYTWSGSGLAADVQAWVDVPPSSYGWILLGDEAIPGSAKRFSSKDNPVAAVRPKLTLNYVAAQAGSGRVPDRVVPLVLSKAGANVGMSWGTSCRASDTDYEVYEGTLGSFASHLPVLCSTSGSTAATVAPSAAAVYFLVVPRNATREGSYGTTSAGAERPPSGSACIPQLLASCP